MALSAIARASFVLSCAALAACAGDPAPEPMTPAAETAPTPAGSIYVVAQRGQSLERIAETYGVEKREIIEANHLKAPYRIKPGAVLLIPIAGAQPAPAPAASKQPAAKPAPAKAGRPRKTGPAAIPLD